MADLGTIAAAGMSSSLSGAANLEIVCSYSQNQALKLIFKGNSFVVYNEVYESVFPIGRGFIDFTDTDYSNYLGFTWQKALVGLIPIGAGTHTDENGKQMTFTLGQEYGEYEHKLTVQELASHSHDFQGGSALFTQKGQDIKGLGPGGYWVEGVGSIPNTSTAGGNQPHNNIQPTYAVNYWQRVA